MTTFSPAVLSGSAVTRPPATRRRRRRLLCVGIAVTVGVVVLDLVGAAPPDVLRSAGASAFGPAQRVLGGVQPGESAALQQENALLRAQLSRDEAALAETAALGRLLQSPSSGMPIGQAMLAARVVGEATTATGAREITVDVGSRDGVEPDVTVVSADGLVGRVVSVSLWSADVRVLGGSDAQVGVRTGTSKLIGQVSAEAPVGAPSRPFGDLSLVLTAPGTVHRGDVVTTLGSIGVRPYLPGIVVGTVVSVDPPRGQLTGTAVVRPAVDPATLEVVGVVTGTARDTPRPTVTFSGSGRG